MQTLFYLEAPNEHILSLFQHFNTKINVKLIHFQLNFPIRIIIIAYTIQFQYGNAIKLKKKINIKIL